MGALFRSQDVLQNYPVKRKNPKFIKLLEKLNYIGVGWVNDAVFSLD